MIRNERQLGVSRRLSSELRKVLAEAERQGAGDDLRRLQVDAMRSQLRDLDREISDYAALLDDPPAVLRADSLRELPICLIRARIASRLSHRALAERLGLKEQAIQRYEANDYAGVSLERLAEIADALGVEVRQELRMPVQLNLPEVIRRLGAAGVSPRLIARRFVGSGDGARSLGPEAQAALLADLERVFGWTIDELRSTSVLEPAMEPQLAASFKKPVNARDLSLRAYVVYAHYIATLAVKTNPHSFDPPPMDWATLRSQLDAHGGVTLRSLVDYAWRRGIAVVPLLDTAGIHGAYWRLGDRAAIVIKQGTRTTSRWLFDLCHELGHASRASDGVVEEDGSDEADEVAASRYAADVLLDGRAEELIQRAVSSAAGDLRRLKSAATGVAEREGVPVGVLANVLAWRLSLQDEDWWATATALQSGEDEPWEVCRDAFLANANLGALSERELHLLSAALQNEGDLVDV